MINYILYHSDTGRRSTIKSQYVPVKSDTFYCMDKFWEVVDIIKTLGGDGNMTFDVFCKEFVINKKKKV